MQGRVVCTGQPARPRPYNLQTAKYLSLNNSARVTASNARLTSSCVAPVPSGAPLALCPVYGSRAIDRIRLGEREPSRLLALQASDLQFECFAVLGLFLSLASWHRTGSLSARDSEAAGRFKNGVAASKNTEFELPKGSRILATRHCSTRTRRTTGENEEDIWRLF